MHHERIKKCAKNILYFLDKSEDISVFLVNMKDFRHPYSKHHPGVLITSAVPSAGRFSIMISEHNPVR